MNYPVLDLHCDTATSMLGDRLQRKERLRCRPGQIDLEKAQKLPGYAQLFAIFTTPNMLPGYTAEDVFAAAVQNFRAELSENAASIALVHQPQEAEKIVQSGKVAAFFSIEGACGIGCDPGRLEALAGEGFCMSTLTWNEENALAGSHKTGGGLTAQGRDYVRNAQKYGIAIDVSHLSDKAFWQIMDITEKPISASHSNSRKVRNVSRNLSDEMFRAICETGGVAGLNLYTDFLGEDPVTVDTACRHILHWLDLGGEKHIALGGDLDGCEALPQGFSDVSDWPQLAQGLARYGVPEEILRDLYWNNAIRMLTECAI